MSRHDDPDRLTMEPTALSVFAEARQAYIAVDTSTGPHVTPDLFTWAADRIWFAAAEPTVKAKVLRPGSRVAVVVAVRGRAVCLSGPVERVDPASPRDLRAAAPVAAHVLAGVSSYAVRNAPDLLAFGRDLLTGRLGLRVPPRRVLLSVLPDAVLTVEGGEVRDSDARRSGTKARPAVGDAAVVAFPGPVASPARWDPDANELHVPVALCPVPIGAETPLAIVVDEFVAPGPAAKQGILLRGSGRHCAPGTFAVEVERVVTWDGVETDAASIAPARRYSGLERGATATP